MVHVRFVEGLVAIERTVGIEQVNYWNITGSVSWTELACGILEYRYYHMELIDEHTNVVLFDAAAETDGYARESVLLVFLHKVLDFGHVALAVRALGAKIVDEQRAFAKMAKENSRVADARKRNGKVHLHGLVGGRVLHKLDVGHLWFGGELGKGKAGCEGHKT